jgi:hypothetical protein
MIQILDKYGNTSTDDGRVIVFNKFGRIKKINIWDKDFNWLDYIVGKTTFIDIIVAGGKVQEYSYAGTTEKRYRFIPSPYNSATDIIYTTFSGGILSNPVAYRLITL